MFKSISTKFIIAVMTIIVISFAVLAFIVGSTITSYSVEERKAVTEESAVTVKDFLENEINRIKVRIENTLSRKALSRAIRLLFKKMPNEAICELEYSSELGNAKATYTLGTFYEFGFGVPADKKAAYELYEAAARGGFFDERNEFKKAILKLSKR